MTDQHNISDYIASKIIDNTLSGLPHDCTDADRAIALGRMSGCIHAAIKEQCTLDSIQYTDVVPQRVLVIIARAMRDLHTRECAARTCAYWLQRRNDRRNQKMKRCVR